MKHIPLREIGFSIVIVIALAAALYIACYYAAVVRSGEVDSAGAMMLRVSVYPTYRWGDDKAAVFFGPAYAIDRRLRPHYWSEDEFLKALVTTGTGP